VVPELFYFVCGGGIVREINDNVISVVYVFVRDIRERGNVVCAPGMGASLGSKVRLVNVDASNAKNGLGTARPTPATNNRFLAVLVHGCKAR